MGKRRTEITDFNTETAEEWEHLKGQSGLIVVDVYTKWAGPCEIMKPVIIKIKLKVRLCGKSPCSINTKHVSDSKK